MNKTVLSVNNVTKKYGKHTIFENVNFRLSTGETIAIVGYSGCGKTTLLRLIGGFENPSIGDITIFGQSVKTPSRNAILVGQGQNQLFPWKTALDNVTWALMATSDIKHRDAEKISRQYLLDLKIAESDFGKYSHQLSGGMKQRVTIARALTLQPQILLLDEPFASLDELTKQKAQDIVAKACKLHTVTTVLVTHDIAEAVKMASKILVFCPDKKIKLLRNTSNSIQRIQKLLNI